MPYLHGHIIAMLRKPSTLELPIVYTMLIVMSKYIITLLKQVTFSELKENGWAIKNLSRKKGTTATKNQLR